MRTWFGGVCWVPKPDRKKEKTITILVKEVVSITMAGAKESTVRSPRMPRDVPKPPPGVWPSIEMSMSGMGRAAGAPWQEQGSERRSQGKGHETQSEPLPDSLFPIFTSSANICGEPGLSRNVFHSVGRGL